MPTYITSFSTEGDLLSQWRAYCDIGGFSIGFNQKLFAEHIKDSEQPFSLKECLYDNIVQENRISEIVRKEIFSWMTEYSAEWIEASSSDHAKKIDLEGDRRWSISLNLQHCLARIVDHTKHHSFSEEKEWRLTSHPGGISLSTEDVDFRSRSGMVVPYTKFKLPEPKSPLWNTCEVIVGPTRFRERSLSSARMLFRRYLGTAPAIHLSETPYVQQ